MLLLTNAHVVSNGPQVRPALRPEKARVSFKALAEEQGSVRYKVKQIMWTSPPEELDATLIELDSTPSGLEGYPIAEYLPSLDEAERACIIGYPEGGTLSLSINDNVLLGYDGRWVHYRPPTKGGSSGSPVLNQDWELIALHYASESPLPVERLTTMRQTKESGFSRFVRLWQRFEIRQATSTAPPPRLSRRPSNLPN